MAGLINKNVFPTLIIAVLCCFRFVLQESTTTAVVSSATDDAKLQCVTKAVGDALVISGGGSPIGQQYLTEVFTEFSLNRTVNAGLIDQLKYDATESHYGILRLMGQVPGLAYVMFASDESFFENDVNPFPDVQIFPILAEATAIVFNLPEITSLNLSMSVIINIYWGKITVWNDSQIQSLNPGVKLPGEDIVVVARQDPAAHTRILTSAFCKYDENWNRIYGEFNDPEFPNGKCCNSTKWPPGVIKYYANKDLGMVDLATDITYMIGYLALNYAALNGATYAALYNHLNYLTLPNSASIQEGMTYWSGRNPNSTYFRLIDAPSPGAYPLLSFLYLAIDFKTMANFSCCQIQEFSGFLDYLIFMPQNKDRAAKYYFVPVYENISVIVARQMLSHVTCDGKNMYKAFLDTLIVPPSLPVYAIALIAAGCVLLVAMVLIIGFVWREQKLSDERHWLISAKSLDLDALVAGGGGQSMSSVHSDSSKSMDSSSKSSNKDFGNRFNVQFPLARTSMEDKQVMMLELDIKLPKHWKKETRVLMFRFCQRMSFPSISHLFGVSIIGTKLFAVQEFLNKGTLHYVLQTSRFEFSDSIRVSIASDVADAVSYLHSRGVVLGLLSSMTCFVTSNWSIKVANWMTTVLSTREDPTYIDYLYRFDKESLKSDRNLIELLYLHPDAPKLGKFTVQSDVFSFGLLLSEIINRATPYQHEVNERKTTYYQILKNKIDLQLSPIPEIAVGHYSRLLERLCNACLTDKMSNFGSIATELHTEQFHGGVTDILMETMEGMIGDMEKKTDELKSVSSRMRELLNQVLPPSIAEKMSNNQTVEPEYFESASVFFSDVVGFTKISARSTPTQVMTFLNDLWITFDSVIEKIDCYKVDTIGDAYMVVSGLPARNGVLHVKHISDLAVALRQAASTFVIRHMPTESLNIRIGLNTGPVTAGVVGIKMPQYCVFGESVNTASRMEQTGMPGRIHASEATARLLLANFPQYKLERRGDIEMMKGKGLLNTYWLEESPVFQKLKRAIAAEAAAAVSDKTAATSSNEIATEVAAAIAEKAVVEELATGGAAATLEEVTTNEMLGPPELIY